MAGFVGGGFNLDSISPPSLWPSPLPLTCLYIKMVKGNLSSINIDLFHFSLARRFESSCLKSNFLKHIFKRMVLCVVEIMISSMVAVVVARYYSYTTGEVMHLCTTASGGESWAISLFAVVRPRLPNFRVAIGWFRQKREAELLGSMLGELLQSQGQSEMRGVVELNVGGVTTITRPDFQREIYMYVNECTVLLEGAWQYTEDEWMVFHMVRVPIRWRSTMNTRIVQ